MQCPRCRAANRNDVRFCEDCGARLAVTCSACGAELTPGKEFCGGCGASTARPETAPRLAAPESYTPKHLAEKIPDGLALLERASGETRDTGRARVVVWAQEMLAQVYLAGGRETESAVTARDALDTSRRIRARGGEARILKVLADIAAGETPPDFDRAQGLYREAHALADEHVGIATTMYREMGMTYGLEKARTELAPAPG